MRRHSAFVAAYHPPESNALLGNQMRRRVAARAPSALWLLRRKRIRKHVICHIPALDNSLSLVERPVNTKVNSALAIFFLSLRERGETTWDTRANIAPVVSCYTVELVRNKGECDGIGSVESTQDLEHCASERCVS